MKITNIVWDIDDENEEAGTLTLPTEVIIDEAVDKEDVADFLSDEFGWCVKGFCIERARKE